VLVDINAPEKAATLIQRQSLDPNSRYAKKKSVTRLRSLLALLVPKFRGSRSIPTLATQFTSVTRYAAATELQQTMQQ
jgi:hypothetical protein